MSAVALAQGCRKRRSVTATEITELRVVSPMSLRHTRGYRSPRSRLSARVMRERGALQTRARPSNSQSLLQLTEDRRESEFNARGRKATGDGKLRCRLARPRARQPAPPFEEESGETCSGRGGGRERSRSHNCVQRVMRSDATRRNTFTCGRKSGVIRGGVTTR